jgi:hypothetical protein
MTDDRPPIPSRDPGASDPDPDVPDSADATGPSTGDATECADGRTNGDGAPGSPLESTPGRASDEASAIAEGSVDYERGDALKDAVAETDEVSSALEALLEGKEAYALETEEYRRWLAYIVKEGRDLEQHLAGILDEIYLARPAFYDPRGWSRLRTLLGRLQGVREDVRAFEYEVEDLTFAFAVTDEAPDDASVAEASAQSIRHTYDRAYDLCLYKLERMGSSWITATNLLISVIMLVVTVLFWMEFW